MFFLLLALAVITTVCIIVLGVYLLGSYDIFFTFVDEATAKAVVRAGGFRRMVMKYRRMTFDSGGEYNVVSPTAPQTTSPQTPPSWREKFRAWWGDFFGGLRWVGVWPLDVIYTYTFRWPTAWRNAPGRAPEGQTLTREGLLVRSQDLNYIFLKPSAYTLLLDEAEDMEKKKLTIVFVFIFRVVNPYKALFGVHDWLAVVSDRLLPYLRSWVAQSEWTQIQTFAQTTAQTTQVGVGDTLREILVKAGIIAEFESRYGIATDAVEIDSIKLPSDIEQASVVKYKAEQDAEKIRIEAQARADATRAEAQAEMERVNMVYAAAKSHGDEGVAMKITEDLAKGGKTVFAIGPALETIRDILRRG